MGLKYIHLNLPIYHPQDIPPFRFNCVEYGLYRSGYPKQKNLPFLEKLHLKTILSLTPSCPSEVHSFCSSKGINHVWLDVGKAKDHVPLTNSDVVKALNLILDPNNHPMLIHCLDGANVTGVLLMCLRKLQLWEHRIFQAEFSRYTRAGVITQDEMDFVEQLGRDNLSTNVQISIQNAHVVRLPNGEIADFNLEITGEMSVHHQNGSAELQIPESLPKWLWTGSVPTFFLKNVYSINSAPSSNPSSAVSTPTTPMSAIATTLQLTYSHPSIRIKLAPIHLKHLLFASQWLSKLTPLEAAKLLLSKSMKQMCISEKNGTSAGGSDSTRERSTESIEVYAEDMDDEYSLTVKALDLEGV